MNKDNRKRQEANSEDLILEIKRLRKEYGQLRDESYEKIDKLEQQLKEANEVIEFYGDKEIWELDESSNDYICSIKVEDTDNQKIGGKTAREYLTK